jgi:phosphotransferase system enzyme I (PtsP)
MDHTKLLYDIGELNNLFAGSISVPAFLQQTVVMVAEHMGADVCSIYLYDEETHTLSLKATHGLDPSSVDKVSLCLGEGLTGTALKELRPICVTDAARHPGYRHFPGINEEAFQNFLAVPIRRGITRIGVLVLQREKRRRFRDEDVMACQAAASQLANVIENARFLLAIHAPRAEGPAPAVPEDLDLVRGHVACEGYACAPTCVVDRETTYDGLRRRRFSAAYDLPAFRRAVAATERQLEELQERVEETLTDAASLIFATHLLLLKDHEFTGAMAQRIENGENAPEAILRVTEHYHDVLRASRNPYVREKVQDVEDLVLRIMANLTGESEEFAGYGGRIVIARQLFPSDLLAMASERTSGVVLVSGGVTSHLSILARSLGIPMLITETRDLLEIPDGTRALLDGETGLLYVDPAPEVLAEFESRNDARDTTPAVAAETRTKDGTPVHLMANINLARDLKLAVQSKCEGIGLYRTEFPFIIRKTLPTEEEQYVAYQRVVEALPGKPVTFRTLDIGGDKVLSFFHDPNEQNPCLGMRSIRFSLRHTEFFAQQIRAILRAGLGADLRIMFPMIGSVEDFIAARQVLHDCMDDLAENAVPHHDHPQIGMMVELPSVIACISAFAEEADFFAIGTNDLIQFILGVDRTNEHVARFYVPHHPSVLRALDTVVRAAGAAGRGVSVCGDMARETQYLPFLLGIGIRTLSLDARYVPRVQAAIARIDLADAQATAEAALRETRTAEIARLLLGGVSVPDSA